jgi:hypothetical protein
VQLVVFSVHPATVAALAFLFVELLLGPSLLGPQAGGGSVDTSVAAQ